MSTAWVAGTVRAAALARRRLDAEELDDIATAGSLSEAVVRLRRTPYRRTVTEGQDLARAQHAVAATLLWRMRVLAGWVPSRGVQMLRVLAAGLEVANVQEHLAALEGRPHEPAFELGTLETAWSRLARTRSADELRHVLAASAWGDPGSATARGVGVGLTLAWAQRVVDSVPVAADWARVAAALLAIREVVLGDGLHPESRTSVQLHRLLGPELTRAVTGPSPTVRTIVDTLPRHVRTALDVTTEDLWQAESALVDLIDSHGHALVRRAGHGPETVVGAVAVLAADAWRTRAALELAARKDRDQDVPSPALIGVRHALG